MTSPVLTLDVAHPPRHPSRVEEDILQAWEAVRQSSSLRILKIVHGYGSTGRGGSTKETVRNWIFLHKGRFRQVIEGEDYTVYNPGVERMRKDVGQYRDQDLDSPNVGITVIWIK